MCLQCVCVCCLNTLSMLFESIFGRCYVFFYSLLSFPNCLFFVCWQSYPFRECFYSFMLIRFLRLCYLLHLNICLSNIGICWSIPQISNIPTYYVKTSQPADTNMSFSKAKLKRFNEIQGTYFINYNLCMLLIIFLHITWDISLWKSVAIDIRTGSYSMAIVHPMRALPEMTNNRKPSFE